MAEEPSKTGLSAVQCLVTPRQTKIITTVDKKRGQRNILVVTFIHAVFAMPNRRNQMSVTTLSSREFNQDTSRAKKAASKGPVFITDRGRPAHVLLSMEEYQRITDKHRNIVDALSMPGLADIEFDPPRARQLPRSADFS
jgi:prevent-host-death family protein